MHLVLHEVEKHSGLLVVPALDVSFADTAHAHFPRFAGGKRCGPIPREELQYQTQARYIAEQCRHTQILGRELRGQLTVKQPGLISDPIQLYDI